MVLVGRKLIAIAAVLCLFAIGVGESAYGQSSTGSGPVLTDQSSAFIGRSYEVFLGRAVTASELAQWKRRFADGGFDPSELTGSLARSDEWVSSTVRQLYQDALDRQPDPGGLAHWVDRLRRGSLVGEVGAAIYGSSEFYRKAGSTPESFVAALYRRILHRDPDAGGLQYWSGQVEKRGRGPVAAFYFGSAESRGDRVDRLYEKVLCRRPDDSGRSYWMKRLVRENDVVLASNIASAREAVVRAHLGGCRTTYGPTLAQSYNSPGDSIALSPDGGWIAVIAEPQRVGMTSGHWFVRPTSTGTYTTIPTDAMAAEIDLGTQYQSSVRLSDDAAFALVSIGGAARSSPTVVSTSGALFRWTRATGAYERLAFSSFGGSSAGSIFFDARISRDGSTVYSVERVNGDSSGNPIRRWKAGSWATAVAGGQPRLEIGDISADGSLLTYSKHGTSGATTNHLYDRTSSTSSQLTFEMVQAMSSSGRYIAYTNPSSSYEAGIYDRVTGVKKPIRGPAPLGAGFARQVSDDGRYVLINWQAGAEPSVGQFQPFAWWRYDTQTDTLLRVGAGNFASSVDGTKVAGLQATRPPGDGPWSVRLATWDPTRPA